MADDLAAEITLRLRAQMSGPIDEIKRLFTSLNDTIGKLNESIVDLSGILRDLKMSDQPVREMGDLAARTNDAVKATQDLNRSLRETGGAGRGRRGGRHALGIGEGPTNADDSVDWLGGAIAGAIGLSTIRQLGDYQNTLRQIAITEKLSGPKANAEVARLGTLFDVLALRDRQSSQGLAEAYFRMVTTHMPPAVVRAIMPDIGMMATAHNISPYSLADAAFAINDSFKIGPKGMLPALEMLATAAKQAHFSLDNFGVFLKEIGGVSETMGLTGRGNLNMVAAGLETVIKNSTQPNQAAADYRDFLVYLNSPQLQMAGARMGFKRRMKATQYLFSKYHIAPIGLWQMEDKAKAHGQNEVTAILQYLHRVTAPMSAGDRAKYLRTLFGNQQSAMTVQSILLHWNEYHSMQKMLAGVTAATGAQDFATALKGANTDVHKFDEELKQLERDIGKTFLGPLKLINSGLSELIGGIDGLNTVTVPAFNTGLGNLTLGLTAAYGTLKAFGAIKHRLFGLGSKGTAAAEDATIEATETGATILAPEVVGAGAALVLAIGNITEALKEEAAKVRGAVAGGDTMLLSGPGGREGTLFGPGGGLRAHNLLDIPRKTPPSGPFVNRP